MDLQSIITNPLAPAPGDTTLLTIQAEGEGCDNWAAYTWAVEAGELLDQKGITVRWVAPMDYGTYHIECSAKLEGLSSTRTEEGLVAIKEFETVPTGKRAAISPRMLLGTLYFIAEDGTVGPRSPDFLGWSVYKISNTGRVTKVTATGDVTDEGAFEFAFAESQEAIYGSFLSAYYSGLRQQRMNVWKFPTLFGSPINASDDQGGTGILRKNQHRFPETNSVGNKAVWKFQFAGNKPDGTADLFNIIFWDEMDGGGEWQTITQSHDSSTAIIGPDTVTVHRYYTNTRPMFTPNEDNILYFVDTTGVMEPCLIPMAGGRPDTLQRRALMVDGNTGIFGQAGVNVSEKTVFQWSPGSSSLLSFISNGEIVFFDYTTESVIPIAGLSKVTEFTWAPDGSQLAAVNDEGLFLVGAGGTLNPDPVFVRERATDDIIGVNWNDDPANPQIAFRLVRKGKSSIDSWSSIVVVDLTSGLWAYNSSTVPWHSSREPADVDYTWMRVMFDEAGTGVYAPFPVLDDVNYPNVDIILVYSHE
jgi:hypothetical protein